MAERGLSRFVAPTEETRPDYDGATGPMDGRYKNPEAQLYLSEETRVALQAYVEGALAHTLADFGLCSREIALEIEAASREVSSREVNDREYGRGQFKDRGTRHDIKALIDAISVRVSDEAKPWVHATATSYDIVATANALQYREAMDGLVKPRLIVLGDNLAVLTEEYADTPQIGRTHGQHAVPITFGFATSRYLGRLGESLQELDRHTKGLNGKFSGAVGGYNSTSLILDDPQAFEAALLAKLGLEPSLSATQVVPGENTTRLLSELVITGGIMAQVAEDIRNLQRTEIGEVGEPFEIGTQTGSSAMPQKKNPITFEQVAGFQRVLLGQIVTSYANLISEHQRDLRDSSASRFNGLIMAEVAHMARSLNRVIPNLEVDHFSLRRNLAMQQGRIAAEPLQIFLREQGHPGAHDAAKRVAQSPLKPGERLVDAINRDAEIMEGDFWVELDDQQRSIILDPESNYLGLTPRLARQTVDRWNEIKTSLQ